MRSRVLAALFLVCTSSFATACDGCGSSAREHAKAAKPASSDELGTAKVPIDPRHEALARFTPSTLQGFVASDTGAARRFGAAASPSLVGWKRSYAKDTSVLELELIDAGEAPAMRALFLRAREVQSPAPGKTSHAIAVKTWPALVQWDERERRGYVTVLVADRLLLNLTLSGASGAEDVVALAQTFDYDALRKLPTN